MERRARYTSLAILVCFASVACVFPAGTPPHPQVHGPAGLEACPASNVKAGAETTDEPVFLVRVDHITLLVPAESTSDVLGDDLEDGAAAHPGAYSHIGYQQLAEPTPETQERWVQTGDEGRLVMEVILVITPRAGQALPRVWANVDEGVRPGCVDAVMSSGAAARCPGRWRKIAEAASEAAPPPFRQFIRIVAKSIPERKAVRGRIKYTPRMMTALPGGAYRLRLHALVRLPYLEGNTVFLTLRRRDAVGHLVDLGQELRDLIEGEAPTDAPSQREDRRDSAPHRAVDRAPRRNGS